MNPVISIYFRNKLKYIQNNKLKFIFWMGGTVISVLLYGFGLSFFIDVFVQKTNIQTGKIFGVVNIFFAILFFIVDIFPSYKKLPYFFPPYYPVSNKTKVLLPLLSYSLKYLNLFAIGSLLIVFLTNNYYNASNFVFSILFLFSVYLLNRVLKNILEFSVDKWLLFLLVGGISVISSFFLIFYNFILAYINSLFSLGVLTGALFYIEIVKGPRQKRINFLKYRIPFISVLFKGSIVIAFGVGILLKALMLLAAAISLHYKGEPLYDSQFFTWIFLSPLIVYTYVGLNFFGFNKNLFLTHIIHDDNIKGLLDIYIKSMSLLLLLDSALFWTFVIINKSLFKASNVVLYYMMAICFGVLGFLFSINKPIFKKKFFSFDFQNNGGANIDFWGVVLTSLLFIILYISSINVISLILISGCFWIGILFLKRDCWVDINSISLRVLKRINMNK